MDRYKEGVVERDKYTEREQWNIEGGSNKEREV